MDGSEVMDLQSSIMTWEVRRIFTLEFNQFEESKIKVISKKTEISI